jgi:hypothetical protein
MDQLYATSVNYFFQLDIHRNRFLHRPQLENLVLLSSFLRGANQICLFKMFYKKIL